MNNLIISGTGPNLKLAGSQPITGLMNFDGINNYISFPDNTVDVTGDKTINLKLYIDSFLNNNYMCYFADVSTDCFILGSSTSASNKLYFMSGAHGLFCTGMIIDYATWMQQILNIEVTKSTRSIDQVKINGIVQSSEGNVQYSEPPKGTFIGRTNQSPPTYTLENATIWDIEIIGENYWKGYPNGNTDAAWIDLIGSADGTVFGDPSTREISGGSSVSGKLNLKL